MIELLEQNIPHISLLGSVIVFCFTVYKYIDTKKNEVKNKRFDQFHKIFEWVAGRTADGKPLVNIQQAMAIYELAEFKEYREISLPIIEYYISETENESDNSLFRKALLNTKAKLE